MPGFGDWDPNLHPRGFHGRFIKKFKLAPWLDHLLKSSTPRTFQSDGQAAQFNFNSARVQPGGAFNELELRRLRMDWDEAADHMRAGEIDPLTQQYVDMVSKRMHPTKEGLILGRTFTPEALGLTPQQLNETDPNGIIRMTGNTITDKAFSPTHLGSDMSHGPGKITMRIAVPQGVNVAHIGENRNDRGVLLDKDQKLLVTRVYPDGSGGWYMTAVAEPSGATTGTPNEIVQGRKGANLTPEQRQARIGGPSVMPQPAEPPRAATQQAELAPVQQPGVRGVEPAPAGPAPTPARQAAREARRAGYQKAVANEQQQINAPAPVAAPPPEAVTPTPSPAPPAGVGERTEPVHGPIGGVPTEGKSASEIANTPAEAPPAPAAPAPQASAASFKQEFQGRGLQSPTAGPQRKEFNDAYLGVTGGKKDPADALRELDADIEKNKTLLAGPEGKVPHEELRANVTKQEKLADLIAEHFNTPRAHKPETAAPTPEAAPAKKGFTSVKELTPSERSAYDSLDQSGRSKYLARRRAGQEHAAALTGAKGEKAPAKAAEKAAPAPKAPAPTSQTEKNAAAAARRAETGQQNPTVNPVNMKKGDTILVRKNKDDKWERTTTKTGATPITVDRVEMRQESAGSVYRTPRRGYIIHGKDAEGNDISTKSHAGNVAFRRHEEKAPRATKAAKAVPEKAPEAAKAAPAKVAKVAKAAPAAKAVSEVQTRADEAGLPNTVTALRQAAREKKIRGFSTMNKEQLQRALLGEEVGTGGKLGAIAPEKLTPHLQAAKSGQEANALLEEHTVADLRALAKQNGISLKGTTTKDRMKDAILKDLRGPEGAALRPEKPLTSLEEDIKGVKVPDEAKSLVDGVSPDDPDSLRNASDELEAMAKTAENPTDAGRLQKLSDAMGMRAQIISGVEAAPPTKKATKAVKKALPAKKLSVHQERVRKQHIADGMDEAEARRLAEEAPTRAPAGTKAATAKRVAERKASSLPGPRAEGEAGPKLSAPKRAAKVAPTPVARENLSGPANRPGKGQLGPNLTPEEKIQALGPGGRTTPRAPKVNEADLKARLTRGKLRSADVVPGDRVMVERDSEGQVVPEMIRGDKAAFPVDVVGRNEDGSLHVRDSAGNEMDTVPPAKSGTSYRPESPTEARRAAKAAAPGEQPTRGRSQAEVLRQGKLGGAQLAPDAAEIKRVLREQTENPISREEADGLLRGLTKAQLMDQADGLNIPRARTLTKDNLRREIVDATVGRKIDSQATRGFKGPLIAKEAVAQAEKAHPEAPPVAVKATRAKVAKAVPDGSVGTRGGELIDNAERGLQFEDGWKKAKIPDVGDPSMQEIHDDVSAGRISPEEGIRRMETEVSMNNEELDSLRRDLRAREGESGPDVDQLKSEVGALERKIAAQEKASTFMHQHFGKERVTVPEVQGKIIDAQGQKWWDNLNKEDPEEFRRILKEETGLDAKGGNAQEIFQDALKQTIKGELDKRAAAKEARNAQKATREAAKAKAVEEFSPGGAKHLDAKAIAGDLNIDQRHIDAAQGDLNQGMSPAKAAQNIRDRAQRMSDANAIINGGVDASRTSPEHKAELDQKYRAGTEEVANLRQLADKVAEAKRPRVTRTPAKAAAEDLAKAKETVKEPAAKKAVARAEAAVKEVGDEAEKLKQRVLDRHQKAWDASTTRAEAEQAATNMRQDLLLSEIRDWAKPMGITGRSKDDILKKAVERRFGSGGDVISGAPGARPEVARVNSRMEAANRVKNIGSTLSTVDELLNNGASERAVSHRVRGSELGRSDPELAQRIERAAVAGDQAELDRIASEHGLTRNTGPVGTVEPFEPGKHRGMGDSSPRKGQAVQVISPGYQGTVEGRAFQAHPAGVLEATPEQKQQMLDRLAGERRDAIASLPAETRAAVIARSQRQRENNAAIRAGKRTPAAAPVAELPTNKQEEVAANLARLNAAKAVKAAPKAEAGTPTSRAFESQLANATTVDQGRHILESMGNKKGPYQELAKQVGIEVRPSDSIAKLRENILRRTVTTRLEHAAYVRLGGSNPSEITKTAIAAEREARAAKKAAPSAGEGAAVLAKGGFNEPFISDKGPVKSVRVRFDEGTSAATFGRGDDLKAPNGRWSADQGLIHMDSEIGGLWKDLASDDRVSTPDLNKITEIGQQLHDGKIDVPTARALIRDIKPGNAQVRERINQAVAGLDTKPSKLDLPDNTPAQVRDFLEKVNEIPAYHDRTNVREGKTPMQHLLDSVKIISKGDRNDPNYDEAQRAIEHASGRVHESGDGVYWAQRESGKLSPINQSAEVRKWIRGGGATPAAPEPAKATPAPAKAAKKAAKAAPTVTKAELRSPVPKAGNEAPAAPTANVTAKGLTPGEGVPVSTFLTLQNRLGSGKSQDLRTLDRYARVPGDYSKVPDLYRKILQQLQQAGVGPDDPVRKAFEKWFTDHFS